MLTRQVEMELPECKWGLAAKSQCAAPRNDFDSCPQILEFGAVDKVRDLETKITGWHLGECALDHVDR